MVAAVEGSGLAKVAAARGLAYGDLFNTGKLDAVANYLNGSPSLFRNVSRNSNHWIALELTGGSESPKDAIGATVYLTANGFRQRTDTVSGGSFASSSDGRVHFGIGMTTRIADIEIHWRGGYGSAILQPGISALYSVTEGSMTVAPVR